MLGPQPSNTYLSATDVVARLDRLAAHSPVREQVEVVAACRRHDRWVLHTSDSDVVARTLVVASGGENVPRTPRLSRAVRGRAHAGACGRLSLPRAPPAGWCRRRGQCAVRLPDRRGAAGGRTPGGGGHQPGRAGPGPAPRPRNRGAGCSTTASSTNGPEDLADAVRHRSRSATAGARRPRRELATARPIRGRSLTGRLIAVDGSRAAVRRQRTRERGGRRPLRRRRPGACSIDSSRASARSVPVEADEADDPVRLDPPTALHLGARRHRYRRLGHRLRGRLLLADSRPARRRRRPRRIGTAGVAPGLWYLGLRWLTRRSSGNFLGFPTDAATVAAAVQAHLSQQADGLSSPPERH